MEQKLYEIRGWFEGLSCAPTALAAISGKPLVEIGAFLQQAAHSNGRDVFDHLSATYDLNDMLLATKLLGSFWMTADKYDHRPIEDRPTIEDWITGNQAATIQLVFCDDGGSDGHIFAAHKDHVIDTYTQGKCIKFEKVPASYRKFRVKLTFLILVTANPNQT